MSSADKAIQICDIQMENAKTASKNTTYISVVRDSYNAYKKDGNKQKLYEEVTLFLTQQYKYNDLFLSTMVILVEEPDTIFYTYSNKKDATYTSVSEFRSAGLNQVLEESKTLDTDIAILNIEGHVYMVRNLMNSSFKPYAMLVMELNVDVLFDSLRSVWGFVDYEIYLNGQVLVDSGISEKLLDGEKLTKVTGSSQYVQLSDNEYYAYSVEKYGNNVWCYLVKLNTKAIIQELDAVGYIFYLLVIFMFALIILVLYFFHDKITKPIHTLVEAAHNIADGNYGYHIERLNTSQEFTYLGEAFNAMSEELRYQFEKLYVEELALRDARIKALQSQINPHFLNNTLEIINWEARLSQNDRVSGMIEALSTMLNATMNRKEQPLITLEEELTYVDAYLYIIEQRFKEKFKLIKEIDESLLTVNVPRLIIQPIIENAVEHGVNTLRQGQVCLRIYRRTDKLIIEVEDSGRLTEEDRKKIALLLSNQEINERDEKFTNLGIRNVNLRLKIIYGEECGLSIDSNESNHTVSILTIKNDNNR